ncbi:hypothetical protein ACFY00_23925 [Kitasatospora sp. NPDC001540]|uniref:hypothetical protein n=1 Tax=Kitasatospora sp. NPDC001540 TaxID=3364014 RepID=UPI0036AE7573
MNTDRHPLWQPFSETATHRPLHPRDGQRPAPVTASPFLEPSPATTRRPVEPHPAAASPNE